MAFVGRICVSIVLERLIMNYVMADKFNDAFIVRNFAGGYEETDIHTNLF